jgi:hypothetical protein
MTPGEMSALGVSQQDMLLVADPVSNEVAGILAAGPASEVAGVQDRVEVAGATIDFLPLTGGAPVLPIGRL